MSLEYWRAVAASSAGPPADARLADLTAELVAMLGSADPRQREDAAWPVLSDWIARGVYDDLLAGLGDSLVKGFSVGLGDTGTDSVFRRVASARGVAACVDRDTSERLLPPDLMIGWAERALHWFAHERDERAETRTQGPACAVSHGADVVRALSGSHYLAADGLGVLLDVVADRVAASHVPWSAREEDRLAFAVLGVTRRELVPIERLEAWVDAVGDLSEHTEGGRRAARLPTPAALNAGLLLRALYTHLSIGVSPAADPQWVGPSAATRADLLIALVGQIPRTAPWLYAHQNSIHPPAPARPGTAPRHPEPPLKAPQ